MDSYQLRSRTQVCVHTTDRQTDTPVTDQTVANTLPMSDRGTDEQTDTLVPDQTVDTTAQSVPTSWVVLLRSGHTFSSHVPALPVDQSDQRISTDSTVDLVLDVPPDRDQQTVGQHFYSRGPRKDRPAFPGLTLSVAEDTFNGTGQGMAMWEAPLVAPPTAESSPQAVGLSLAPGVHPSHRSSETRASLDIIPVVTSDILLQQEHLLWNLGRPSKNPAYRILQTEYSGCL